VVSLRRFAPQQIQNSLLLTVGIRFDQPAQIRDTNMAISMQVVNGRICKIHPQASRTSHVKDSNKGLSRSSAFRQGPGKRTKHKRWMVMSLSL
jgi:hypothetical protein